MKKLIAIVSLTLLLITGFTGTNDHDNQNQAADREPVILSISEDI